MNEPNPFCYYYLLNCYCNYYYLSAQVCQKSFSSTKDLEQHKHTHEPKHQLYETREVDGKLLSFPIVPHSNVSDKNTESSGEETEQGPNEGHTVDAGRIKNIGEHEKKSVEVNVPLEFTNRRRGSVEVATLDPYDFDGDVSFQFFFLLLCMPAGWLLLLFQQQFYANGSFY